MANDPNSGETSEIEPRSTVESTHLPDLEASPHAEVFEGGEPRTVRLHLAAGESVPTHRHPDATVVIYLVAGRLELGVGSDTHHLHAGDAIRFDGKLEVSPAAIEESVALVVLAPKTDT